MERRNNYAIQAGQAKALFLQRDIPQIVQKLHAQTDADYLYTRMFSEPYRISLHDGSISRCRAGEWIAADSFDEVMTLLDFVCDSSPDRYLTGRWKNMTAFGLQFHQGLMEIRRDPQAAYYEANLPAFRAACTRLGGRPWPTGDAAYVLEAFDGLPLLLQLWTSDEEFPAQLRYLWDENALMYLKYETMYYALSLLHSRLKELMEAESGQ